MLTKLQQIIQKMLLLNFQMLKYCSLSELGHSTNLPILVKQTDWCNILGSTKPPKVNQVKHLLIILSLLILTSPLVAQETGVLYFKKVNGKYGWFENGNDKKDWKYVGEIKNGKPNGTGVLGSTSGKYSGDVKNGMKHCQGTLYIQKWKKESRWV